VTGTVLLAAYAVAAGSAAPVGLRRGWARRAPRLAIAAWLILAASWLAAVPLAALAVMAPSALTWPASGDSAAGTFTGTPAAAAVVLLAASIPCRAGWHLARGLAADWRGHRAHAAFLAAAGRFDPALGAVITADDAPAAYCLPSGRHRVVISAGALARLSPGQLRAVLAHERAHLRGRHHLILTATAALARAFPVIPLFTGAAAELAVLAEMAADDNAARRHQRGDIASAMVTLAGAASHRAALAAGGPAAIARVQRLLAPPSPPALPARITRLAIALVVITIPAGITALPLAIAACSIITRT
jgi:Zn-dependent protease with chaperone function